MRWCMFIASSCLLGLVFAIVGLPPVAGPVYTWIILLASLVLAVLVKAPGAALKVPALGLWSLAALGIWSTVTLRSFLWVGYENNGSLRIQSHNNLGDLSLHLQFIQYLSKVQQYWPESPILSNHLLQYPIGMDFFNSLLLNAGIPLLGGLVLVGVTSGLVLGWQLWRWAGAFGIFALLFSGGLAGIGYFTSFAADDWQGTGAWKNIFLSMVVPQRNMLFVLPAGILLLRQWQSRVAEKELPLPAWSEWILFMSMPLFSIHAFIFFFGYIVFATLLNEHRWYWAVLGLGTLPVTSLLVYLVTGHFEAGSGIHWNLGWMQGEEGLKFWIINFGMMLPLVLGAVIFGWQNRRNRILLINCLFWLAVSLFVSFSKWPWDNSKLMVWCWLGLLPIIWQHLLSPLRPSIRSLVLVSLFFTGAISLWSKTFTHSNFEVIPLEELASTQQSLKGVSFSANIACRPTYNNAVALLGRPVIVGYDGHLWSHGLNYHETYASLEHFLHGEGRWRDQIRNLGIEYVLWGSQEKAQYGDNKDWMAYLDIPYEDEKVRLYKVPPNFTK